MKISAKKLLNLVKNNDDNILKYTGVDFSTILVEEEEELLSFIIKNVFFYNDNKFSYKELKEKKKKIDWVQILLNEACAICEKEKEDIYLYMFFNKLFSQFFYPITKEYSNFLDSINPMKEKYPYDLFACLIAFLSYLNGNNNYINIFQDVCDNDLLIKLKMKYDIHRNKMLWSIVTKYCNMYNITVINELHEDINIDELKIQLIEINCFSDICQVNHLYKKLAKTIFQCLSSCDFKDLRKNRPTCVKNFIENIFVSLNLYLENDRYSQEYYLSYIFSQIFSNAYEYTSKYFNENYVDFVVQYVSTYNLPTEDFFDLFMTGLDKENFVFKFKNIQLKDKININDKDTIKNLVDEMLSGKKKKKKSKKVKSSNQPKEKYIKLSESQSKNDKIKDYQDETKKSLNKIENEETNKKNNLTEIQEKEENKVKETQNSVSNNDSNNNCELIKIKNDSNIQIENPNNSLASLQKEFSDFKSKYSELDKKNKDISYDISILKKENADMNSKIADMNSKISELEKEKIDMNSKITKLEKEKIDMNSKISSLKEEINDLNDDKGKMNNQISSLNLKMKEANERAGRLNELIEIISFRDLTKRMLDNMIGYVKEKDENLLNGISKRKEKLKVIIKKFNFKDIRYMRNAIDELNYKYYNSNITSHVPDYVQSIKKKPYGLITDPESNIVKKYYQIMIESKDERILDFMINHLFIRNEIRSIYLDSK